uniref:Ankyrin repeat domain-containing protein 60 n=1 Tax=Pogona vitticeps TaxID=103695 RepID=A0A6J0TXS7_9SAUR
MPRKKRHPAILSQTRTGLSSRLTALSRERSLRSGEFGSAQIRCFNLKLYIVETDELFVVPDCQRELTIKNLKSRLELLVGIPIHFQRLQYLDEVDLDDASTIKQNDIIPGGTLTLRIWSEDAWGRLVIAAAKGKIGKLRAIGATNTSTFSTANADLMGPEAKSEWLAHRAFVALFITVRRGHSEAVEFLLQNGADVKRKTPLGRTALHVAVTSGHVDCIDILLNYGAKVNEEDHEGYTPITLARLWGQKDCERRLFRYQWKMRSGGTSKPRLDEKVES